VTLFWQLAIAFIMAGMAISAILEAIAWYLQKRGLSQQLAKNPSISKALLIGAASVGAILYYLTVIL